MASKYLEHPPLTSRERRMLEALRMTRQFIHPDQRCILASGRVVNVAELVRDVVAEIEKAER